MPAVTSDTIALPRVPDPGPEAAERPVVSVTTAPSGLEGEGFPVRRAFAGVDRPSRSVPRLESVMVSSFSLGQQPKQMLADPKPDL